jgi:tetratricopeptide (TPR) repeat protein
LSRDDSQRLLHLLTCPLCGQEETLRMDMWRGLQAPEPCTAAPARAPLEPEEWRKAERLADTLLRLPQAGWSLRFRNDKRYAQPAVAEVLLEKSARAQADDPGLSYEVAELVASTPRGLAEAGPALRAELLMANAARLAGRPSEAEVLLDKMALFLTTPDVRGAFCRLRALLLWEQGRLEEAHAFLRQAVVRFAEARQPEEEGATQALLGLLLRETGDGERCFAALLRALALPFAERRPWLGTRVALALSWVLLEAGAGDEAQTMADWADRLVPGLATPEETAWAFWWHGRMFLALGEAEVARERLLAARGAWLQHRRLAAAALTTLDLAAAVPAEERAAALQGWIAETEEVFAGVPGLDEALLLLHKALHGGPRESTSERRKIFELTLLLRFRAAGLRPDVLPFA